MSHKKKRVTGFCIRLIREKRRISVSELYKAAKAEFPNYSFSKRWLSRNVKKAIEGTNIVKWRPANREQVFGLREEREKNYKPCLYCGKLMPGNREKWCSEECYKELEKIANFFVPLPSFPSSSVVKRVFGTRHTLTTNLTTLNNPNSGL